MTSKFRHLLFALCFAQTVVFAMNTSVSANTPDAVFSEEVSEDAELSEDVFVPVCVWFENAFITFAMAVST